MCAYGIFASKGYDGDTDCAGYMLSKETMFSILKVWIDGVHSYNTASRYHKTFGERFMKYHGMNRVRSLSKQFTTGLSTKTRHFQLM